MSSRLGGSRTPVNKTSKLSKLHFFTYPTMTAAMKSSRRQVWAGSSPKDAIRQAMIGQRPLVGDPDRLKAAQAKAEELAEEAIHYDQRLAARSQWRRRDEGEHVCAALLAEGDDQPFYKRQRTIINDATSAGEPMRIVISTDDNDVPEGTAAAFIATARLVQQFVPLDVWWQGAWLTEDRRQGFVFTVPLVAGDMDYTRLEFCIADDCRDNFSFDVAVAYAFLEVKESNHGCGFRAEAAYRNHEGHAMIDYRPTTKFISHVGIRPTGASVADTAASWLGMESIAMDNWRAHLAASSAGQSIPAESKPHELTDKDKAYDAANRARWAQEDAERKAKAAREARERLAV